MNIIQRSWPEGMRTPFGTNGACASRVGGLRLHGRLLAVAGNEIRLTRPGIAEQLAVAINDVQSLATLGEGFGAMIRRMPGSIRRRLPMPSRSPKGMRARGRATCRTPAACPA